MSIYGLGAWALVLVSIRFDSVWEGGRDELDIRIRITHTTIDI